MAEIFDVEEILNDGETGAEETEEAGEEEIIEETPANQEEPPSTYKHYFKYARGSEEASCLSCGKKVSRDRQSTNGMRSHLKSKHKSLWKLFCDAQKQEKMNYEKKRSRTESTSLALKQNPPKQVKISEMISVIASKKWPQTHPKSIELDMAVLRYMCLSCDSLNLPDKPGFRDLLSLANPSYNLRGRNTFTELFEQKFFQIKQKMVEYLQQQQSLSFTVDIWSTKNNKKSFLSLTAHFIDQSIERQFCILSSEPIEGSHTAINIGKYMKQMLDDFQIPKEKVHLVLRDAASAMRRAIEDLEFNHADCFIHKIQLAIRDGIEHNIKAQQNVKSEIQLCRKLVGISSRSKPFRDALMQRQKQLNMFPKELVQDNLTRWNSSYYMLQRLVELKDAISLVSMDFKETPAINFDFVSAIIKVLDPFEKLTLKLQSRIESVSSVLPAYYTLLHCLRPIANDLGEIRELEETIAEGLKSRMEMHLEQNFLICATILDPRYKNNQNIFDEYSRKRNKLALQHEALKLISPLSRRPSYEDYQQQDENDDPIATFLNAAEPDENFDDLQLQLQLPVETNEKIEAEIEAYIKAKCESSTADPLVFWKNDDKFPHLKKLAIKFLGPPPSTAESERVFSTMGEIYLPKRSSLLEDHGKMQLFLHYNFDF